MHQTDIPYIDKNNIGKFINSFISEVANKYGPTLELKMLIVGGSALAIKYGFRATVDIDADIKCSHSVKGSINKAAEKLGVPSDFINEDFTTSDSYSRKLWDNAILLKQYNTDISIYVVSDVDQLCMKIVSARIKDDADIRMLTEKVRANGVKYTHIEERLKELYKGKVAVSARWLRYVKGRLRVNGK